VSQIQLKHVSVAFPIYDASSRSLKKRVLGAATGGRIRSESGPSVVQALDDVTLHFKHGDRVGLVGHNGAGKTTLLRVLAGIYEPGGGTVRVEGSVAPLFDITLGMDPESTGYENIMLRGLYLGLSRDAIRERMPEIAEFTELGSFLDLPIRTYSAGMRMRLAFAVSTSIHPDILLLDEGIGAGDAAFLEKANRRLQDFTNRAAIIVLASHSEQLVKQLCPVSVLMEHGRVIQVGETESILTRYRGGSALGPV
jgi:ABC-2 type transport system ATP-binding protein/lipopolysaccharide transport system ATP-binding protein